MEQLVMRSRFFRLVGAAAFAAALAAPAAADPVYSWRTEDGGYAFTDDPKAIPRALSRSGAEARDRARLHDYKRYTPSDDAATERYAEQLTRRLEHLRAVNANRVVASEQGEPRLGADELLDLAPERERLRAVGRDSIRTRAASRSWSIRSSRGPRARW